MTVFRVEKNANYTVMSNEHLRNRSLSLKAKGLLSQMLSLPDSRSLLRMKRLVGSDTPQRSAHCRRESRSAKHCM